LGSSGEGNRNTRERGMEGKMEKRERVGKERERGRGEEKRGKGRKREGTVETSIPTLFLQMNH